MTTTLKAPEISRRGMLAGLGGMTFCLALGTEGLGLISEAQANTMANTQITQWIRIAPDGTITITLGSRDFFWLALAPRRGDSRG